MWRPVHRFVRAVPGNEGGRLHPDHVTGGGEAAPNRPGPGQDFVDCLHQVGLVVAVGPAAGEQKPHPEAFGGPAYRFVDGGGDVKVLMVDDRGGSAAQVLDQPDAGGHFDIRRGEVANRRPDGVLEPL